MIKAIIFDCFGVLITTDANVTAKQAEVKNQPLLTYISELRATYKIGLLSNVSAGGLHSRFLTEELSLFDAVVASGEIGYVKPDAQAYEYVADRLNVRLDDCLMVDDRQDHCNGALRVGMAAVCYKNLAQLQSEIGRLTRG